LGDDAKREWVARYPERLHSRGYWVRPFSSDLLSIRYLVTTMADYLKKDNLRRGVNTVLGMEYADSNCRLEREDIVEAFENRNVPPLDKTKECFIGIDIGAYCHVTINTNASDVVYFGVIPSYKLMDVLQDLDSKYNIVAGGIDRYPETTLSNAIRDWSKGRIWPMEYKYGKEIEPVKDANGETSYYRINRTNALDVIKEGINTHRMKFYGYGDYQNIIIEHLRDMYRDDARENTQPMWRKMNGNDHFFHSLAYGFAARKIYDYLFMGETDERSVVALSGTELDKNFLYNSNLLQYSRDNIHNKRFIKR
jgi:hypothetical protein